MRRTLVAGAAVLLAGIVSAAPRFSQAQTAISWPTFHGDRARDGVSSAKGPTTGTAISKFTLPVPAVTGSPIQSSPVVDANNIGYVGSENGNVYALDPFAKPDAKTGIINPVRWTFKTGGPVISTGTFSSDGSVLFIGSDDGNVYAINTKDGTKKWATDLGGPVRASPLLSSDGSTIYVPNINGRLFALSTSDGSQKWANPFQSPVGPITGSVASTPDGGTLYVVTGAQLYAIPASGPGSSNLTTGYLNGSGSTTPAVDQNGNIYVGTVQGYLDCFTPTMAACWSQQHQVPNFPSVVSTPSFLGGNVIFGGGKYIFAISQQSGSQVWQVLTGGVNSSPTVTTGNSMIYVGSVDGNLYALDSTGKVVFTRTLGGSVDSTPAVANDGALWVADRGGSVLRLGAIGAPPSPNGTTTGNNPTPTATQGSGPTATPTATSVSASPTATATTAPSLTPLTLSLKGSVKAGQKQTIQVTSAPNTAVKLRIEYPNGDHQSKKVTTNAGGNASYTFTQGASKITHKNFTATVTAKAGSGASQNSTSQTYTIGFGTIDVSVEPRSQSVGKQIDIFVHAKAGTKVVVYLLPPKKKIVTKGGHTGKKGFASIKFTIPKGFVSGVNVKVPVLAKFQKNPNISTKSSFTVK